MGSIRKDTYICLDCETTGLSVETDQIIEVAVQKFNFDGTLESFETLIDPGIPIPPDSMAIHKITDEMVRGKPKIEEVLPEVFKLMGKHTVVGHNICYDLAMLKMAANKLGIPCPINPENSIDTLRLARLYAESPSNSLETLRKHFNIEEEGAHRAMNDVVVNVKVFKYLAIDFRTTEEILERLKAPILLKTMPLGKHKGLPFRDIPQNYLHWASNQDFDMDLSFTIKQERNRRKKHKPFSQSSNPFSDL